MPALSNSRGSQQSKSIQHHSETWSGTCESQIVSLVSSLVFQQRNRGHKTNTEDCSSYRYSNPNKQGYCCQETYTHRYVRLHVETRMDDMQNEVSSQQCKPSHQHQAHTSNWKSKDLVDTGYRGVEAYGVVRMSYRMRIFRGQTRTKSDLDRAQGLPLIMRERRRSKL